MIYSFSPSFFYKENIGERLDYDYLIDKCTINDEWQCSVKTSRGIKNDWSKLEKIVSEKLKNFPLRKNNFKLSIETPWMNVYENGDYQEPHHHVSNGFQFSFCYFYRLPKNCGKFSFYNESYRNYCADNMNQVLDLESISFFEWIIPDVVEKDLIIFPSHYIHQVSQNKTEEKRITISGNIKLEVTK